MFSAGKRANYCWSMHGASFRQTFPPWLTAGIGAPGHGGEYEVVAGFGWTNGVALSLLEEYGWAEGAE